MIEIIEPLFSFIFHFLPFYFINYHAVSDIFPIFALKKSKNNP